jgi:enediyne polyketide synthase
MTAIAIIGMACRYAEARSPGELWENVLAQRRSFRRLPRVRLNLADYSGEGQNEDRITAQMAAVLDDYEFDRSRFHVSQTAFAATDLTHWLALDVAAQALVDARVLASSAKQRERTAVYMGNTLTGEFSRANLLRLRWPYVRRVLAGALQDEADRIGDLETLIARIETLYKAPFPPTNEESLAGGLSNTIAGRICNYFDFKGGGYTVDGACASSLLALATACSALQSGDVDVALAGGVDLSLDPFELAGFSSLGALAGDNMRVFDAQSSGFWPGEGCGVVVLMRHEDALANHLPPYALIQGWGISSDGQGGITRPEVSGQVLALRRAYDKAGYGINSVNYFEGHGTGTSIGDAIEVQALSRARCEAGANHQPAALGSIKANIGHTKAAAGVAGLIKTAMAVQSKILPPTTGCDRPHPELTTGNPELRVLAEAELWPESVFVRAGVSAFGFGGINVHVTLEATNTLTRKSFTSMEAEQIASVQDCELFLFAASDTAGLSAQLEEVLRFAGEISYAELADLSIFLAQKVNPSAAGAMVRAACVASSPDELVTAIRNLLACCETDAGRQIDVPKGTFLGRADGVPRIGFLFPGQASPVYTSGGSWVRRFPSLRALYARADLPKAQSADTATAQPCIVTASLAGLEVLSMFGVQGAVAVGHSLGEITALCWAGACTEEEVIRVVHARGRAMADEGDRSGAMVSIRASHDEVLQKLNGDGLVIAAHNAPLQTVVAGEARAVKAFSQRLHTHGLSATMLPVSHAFHSPLVARVATAFSDYLSRQSFAGLSRRVVSTVTAAPLAPAADLKTLLTEQITRPVLFAEALTLACAEADLFIEVGPGSVLTGIAAECTDKPVIALDAGGKSLRGLCSAMGAAFALGADVRTSQLFEKRFGREIDPGKRHTFLANPCETAPESLPSKRPAAVPVMAQPLMEAEGANSAVDTLLALVARRTQLPQSAIKAEHRFLNDLHLNSITISQLMFEAATQLSLPAPVAPGEFTNASIAEAAAALDGLRAQTHDRTVEKHPHGVDSWSRVLSVTQVERPLRRLPARSPGNWEIAVAEESVLQNRLREKFRTVPGAGLVCCVPGKHDARAAAFLLRTTKMALQRDLKQITFLQQGSGVGALARALYLEHPDVRVTVVNAPFEHPDAAEWAAAEASANYSFVEACYDFAGVRREPRLKLAWPEPDADCRPLGSDDVLLVTGGGKGIAAESALHLARLSGCRLALLGRSDPTVDPELRRNLDRISAAGICFDYLAVDITDKTAVNVSVQRIVEKFGPITAILHGAGLNRPRRLEELTTTDVEQTLAPKLTGLRNLLDAVNPAELRLLLTFGSIIARTGLHGEAHYGLANEWLNLMVEDWQKEEAHCRCLNLEWSVWAGIGMGQNLGVLDSLIRQGIAPLSVDEAMEHLQSMLDWKQAPASVIVTGRFGSLPTLRFDSPDLPLLRFLEHPRIYYPGIELIADAELSVESDPYVTEHVFQGEQLFPAVMGMEAMAQAAQALEQSELIPCFRNLRFEYPIVVPRDGHVTVRVAALRRRPGLVAVVIRCSTTDFQIEHFSGECDFDPSRNIGDSDVAAPTGIMSLDPLHDLYGHIFFQSGRFRRVAGYEVLHSDRSLARLDAPTEATWFAHHLPPALVMGDAASRDAALHSIQAAIPHKTILPVAIDRITPAADWTSGPARVLAAERASDGDNFIYDLRIEDSAGRLCEAWEGLHLRAVASIEIAMPWPQPLLVAYIERRVRQILAHGEARIRLATEQGKDQLVIGDLVRETFGPNAMLIHRPDGKPEIAGLAGPQPCVSFSHSGDSTLLFSAERIAGCDLEQVCQRDGKVWEQLLGQQEFALARRLAGTSNGAFDSAATKVWTMKESLRKAGCSFSPPMCLGASSPDGWASFSAGRFKGATFCTQINGAESNCAFGFVIDNTP